MQTQLTAQLVDSNEELQQILALQQANLKINLSASEIAEQGFVTVEHTPQQLLQMHKLQPSIIVKDGAELAGYALVMPRECATIVPVLIPAFELLEKLVYKGRPVQDWKWYMMGQVCVAKNYRGMGVFKQLYDAHQTFLRSHFQLCITEISTSNTRSLRAHQKVGFSVLHTYTDATDEWAIVVLEL
jgi:GNAT superfamily N-acetyltransferase